MIDLELSKDYASVFCEEIASEITKVEFVGAIRRKIHKIDVISLLVIPVNLSALGDAVIRVASEYPSRLGPKMMSFKYVHFKVNIFIANYTNYELLKFIRTGPESFCKKACQRAKEYGLKIHADGSGIEKFDSLGQRTGWITPKSEEDIFLCLGWPYIEPQNRI